MQDMRQTPGEFPNVSVRWLLGAAAFALVAAIGCAWLTLCLLYWQGSWQLLYHPQAAISRTPASLGIPYEPIRFAVTETGTPQLTGWWIPDAGSRFTLLYLHGSDGNLSDTVDTLAALRKQNLNIFAIDYRGYGQSQPVRPSESHLRQDAEWALDWLTQTRKIPAKSIVVCGTGVGANLAAELAGSHGELAGVILDQPLQDPLAPVFNDPRSKLVPAHWLVPNGYDLTAAATSLRVPSLWLFAVPPQARPAQTPTAYEAVQKQKTAAWLKSPITADPNFAETLHRWLDDL
jgi:pimeloyl-ACP methyl ester carboxylesterase